MASKVTVRTAGDRVELHSARDPRQVAEFAQKNGASIPHAGTLPHVPYFATQAMTPGHIIGAVGGHDVRSPAATIGRVATAPGARHVPDASSEKPAGHAVTAANASLTIDTSATALLKTALMSSPTPADPSLK